MNIHELEEISSIVDSETINKQSPVTRREYIQLITLEDIFRQNNLVRCNFLKIDCEGYEYNIIMNTPKQILKRIEYIAMESTDYENTFVKNQELLKYLKDNNFDLTYFSKHDGNVMRIFAKNASFNR